MSIDDKRSYDEMLWTKIQVSDMEYWKYYGIINGEIIKPSIELNEYWTMQLYGNAVRKIEDDELIMKLHPLPNKNERWIWIGDVLKKHSSTIDTLL